MRLAPRAIATHITYRRLLLPIGLTFALIPLTLLGFAVGLGLWAKSTAPPHGGGDGQLALLSYAMIGLIGLIAAPVVLILARFAIAKGLHGWVPTLTIAILLSQTFAFVALGLLSGDGIPIHDPVAALAPLLFGGVFGLIYGATARVLLQICQPQLYQSPQPEPA